jgi:hypothetical protein
MSQKVHSHRPSPGRDEAESGVRAASAQHLPCLRGLLRHLFPHPFSLLCVCGGVCVWLCVCSVCGVCMCGGVCVCGVYGMYGVCVCGGVCVVGVYVCDVWWERELVILPTTLVF